MTDCTGPRPRYHARSPERAVEKRPKTVTKPNWSKLSFLVVEDDALIADLIKTYLRQFGARTVVVAENGKIALERLKEAPRLPDLIICDMQMPEMNGLEFTAILRAEPYKAVSTLPVMACTTMSSEEVVDEAVRLGMDGFIVKPIDPKSMFARIEAVLKKRNEGEAQVWT